MSVRHLGKVCELRKNIGGEKKMRAIKVVPPGPIDGGFIRRKDFIVF